MSSDPPQNPADSPADDDIEDDVGTAPASDKPPNWTVQIVKAERTIYELFRRWADGKGTLDLQPDFQRGLVWNREKQSALVESVLLRIPLPVIYLSEESEQKTLVIDGQQRLTTLFDYMQDGFALRDLRLMPELGNLKFSALETRLQRRFEDTAMTAFIIQQGSDARIKFEVFQRLNQGAVELNAQEIRNALYRGPGLQLVKDLAAPGGLFREVAGTRRQFKRMRAEELVLRCLAFIDQGPAQYKGSILEFLNQELTRLNRMSANERVELRQRMEQALLIVREIFGDNAFRRYIPEENASSSALNAAFMEVLVAGYSTREAIPLETPSLSQRNDAKQRHHRLMGDRDFVDAITLGTGDRNRVQTRFRLWTKGLLDAAKDHG